MHRDGEQLVLSPTDLTKHLACRHLTTLDLAVADGRVTKPEQEDEALELIFRLGLDHEKAYLSELVGRGLNVGEIPEGTDLPTRCAATLEAMRAGADVVYQATFLHDGHRGHADFLLRVERPSALGAHSYDVADTKLARRMKVPALVQMAAYGKHLERIQGHPPEWLSVVTGDKAERRYRYHDVAAYAERALQRLQHALAAHSPTVAEPVGHCAQCRWSPRCSAQWRAADHPSLVAFMRGDHRVALESAGITTVAALAEADPDALPRTIGGPSRIRLQAQAALQIKERTTKQPHYELLAPAAGRGLLRLPDPSEGDLYLDFEGDPYAEGGEGREYLAGIWNRKGEFTTFWAHDADEERALTRNLLSHLVAALDADPTMHVYHYAPYERTALAKLTQRHSVGEQEFDRLLRGERLVDLYAVVRQGLRISKESYSIKKLEAFYWSGVRGSGAQEGDVADAMSSVIEYERWLVTREPAILDSVAAYNRDDVRSTHDLHDWLERRRTELAGREGPLPRPDLSDPEPSPELTVSQATEAALAEELRVAGYDQLAGLVGWHRREDKPAWWDHYRVDDLSDEELIEDGAALGGLGEPEAVGTVKRSTIWRYPFPPQDTKIGADAYDVDTHKRIAEVVGLDAVAGWVDLKLGSGREAPRPRGLGPAPPLDARAMRDSIARTARDILDCGTPLGLRLLERTAPADLTPRPGELARQVVLRVGPGVRDAVLAVQGPPGSGKTTVGGELIRALLDGGLTVGVTAQSHAVIGNLLREVDRPALHKCTPEQHSGAPRVTQVGENSAARDALADGSAALVGGVAWLWAREDMESAVDVLVIDEAGQFSLANAVAVASCARGLVMLGDPQQLTQPTQAQHPDGAGLSALEHLLDGAPTIPPDRGVFLDLTYRMHPDLTHIVSRLMYEDRLESAPGMENQRLLAPEPWGGAGLRWVPVVHTGNESASGEEALAVRGVVDAILGTRWVDASGAEHPVGPADVLVVAPYNAHVARLRAQLPAGVRVGTVDKFQGQQAPVVIYSMASSSAEDAPRGVTFLYDTHRLNVAISRARCVAVVVGSPALLDAAVSSPANLRRVNGLIGIVNASR